MIRRLLIANGGEIAVRIRRTGGEPGIETVDGITTNIALQRSIMDDARLVSGAFGTRLLEAR